MCTRGGMLYSFLFVYVYTCESGIVGVHETVRAFPTSVNFYLQKTGL